MSDHPDMDLYRIHGDLAVGPRETPVAFTLTVLRSSIADASHGVATRERAEEFVCMLFQHEDVRIDVHVRDVDFHAGSEVEAAVEAREAR